MDKWAKDVKGSRREVEEDAELMDGIEVGEGRGHQVHDEKTSSSGLKARLRRRKVSKAMVGIALPFLQGVSPAGFLSASRRQPGGSDHVIQVMWPLCLLTLHFLLLDLSCY